MKLNDEQQMLQDSVARLMADKGPVSHLRELRDRNDEKGYDEPLWHAMVESGLTGILVPEEHGGIGFGLVGAGLVAREIGRNLSVTPFLSTAVLGATALATGGSAEQQQKWLPAIAEGSVITAWGPNGELDFYQDCEGSGTCSSARDIEFWQSRAAPGEQTVLVLKAGDDVRLLQLDDFAGNVTFLDPGAGWTMTLADNFTDVEAPLVFSPGNNEFVALNLNDGAAGFKGVNHLRRMGARQVRFKYSQFYLLIRYVPDSFGPPF